MLSPSDSRREGKVGVACALGGFLLWGALPVYFKAVAAASALEILCHRIVWSAVLLTIVVVSLRRSGEIREAIAGGRLRVFLLTSVIMSSNWLLYIWAVNTGHIVDASLGYYINPLVNVVLGLVFLHERLSRLQGIAIALAVAGVASLVLRVGRLPWLALVLPFQFALYTFVRKKAKLDPLVGLLVETLLLAPVALGALAWLGARGQLAFGSRGIGFDGLLALAGVLTAVPLLLFLLGAAKLRLSTLGVLQYVSPTCQLLTGVLLYKETFSLAHAGAFAFIWAGLALYSADAFRAMRTAARIEGTGS